MSRNKISNDILSVLVIKKRSTDWERERERERLAKGHIKKKHYVSFSFGNYKWFCGMCVAYVLYMYVTFLYTNSCYIQLLYWSLKKKLSEKNNMMR
jgi:hypothetical protein